MRVGGRRRWRPERGGGGGLVVGSVSLWRRGWGMGGGNGPGASMTGAIAQEQKKIFWGQQGFSFYLVPTKMSWRSMLTVGYLRRPLRIISELSDDDPTNDCGSGSDMRADELSLKPKWSQVFPRNPKQTMSFTLSETWGPVRVMVQWHKSRDQCMTQRENSVTEMGRTVSAPPLPHRSNWKSRSR